MRLMKYVPDKALYRVSIVKIDFDATRMSSVVMHARVGCMLLVEIMGDW